MKVSRRPEARTSTTRRQGTVADDTTADFRREVLEGLSLRPKRLSPKWLYDERGSELFEKITELDEYYLTSVENDILAQYADEMVRAVRDGAVVIEFGSGSSTKTRMLLDRLSDLSAYVPIDISRDHLLDSAAALQAEYPDLNVVPLVADYTKTFDLPDGVDPAARRVVFFPGSTIGNFHPVDAGRFLVRIARLCGQDGGLLIGFDMKKDPVVLHRAYNDSCGVTAEFNLNLLRRINDELGGDFDLDTFRSYAFYNPVEGRIEMHLVSMADQDVTVAGNRFHFAEGETLWTESSYKFSQAEFGSLAGQAGFKPVRTWTDDERRFAVTWLAVA